NVAIFDTSLKWDFPATKVAKKQKRPPPYGRACIALRKGSRLGGSSREASTTKGEVCVWPQSHGRVAPGACVANLSAFAARSGEMVRTPDHTSCKPAQMAIKATTVLSFCAGTRLANKQPSTTPGTPPVRNSSRTGALMEPSVQCTALPITAKTS